jgi:uncharacterized protein YcfJ
MKNRTVCRSFRTIALTAALGLAAISLSACAPMDTYSNANGSYGYQDQGYQNPGYQDQGYYTGRTRTVCRDVQVRDDRYQRDPNRVAGTAIGAIAGGLLGNTIGGGSGKTLATVGGAVVGGYVGNQVQANGQRNSGGPEYHIERRCTQERY